MVETFIPLSVAPTGFSEPLPASKAFLLSCYLPSLFLAATSGATVVQNRKNASLKTKYTQERPSGSGLEQFQNKAKPKPILHKESLPKTSELKFQFC